jgi:hypothetical protein
MLDVFYLWINFFSCVYSPFRSYDVHGACVCCSPSAFSEVSIEKLKVCFGRSPLHGHTSGMDVRQLLGSGTDYAVTEALFTAFGRSKNFTLIAVVSWMRVLAPAMVERHNL